MWLHLPSIIAPPGSVTWTVSPDGLLLKIA